MRISQFNLRSQILQLRAARRSCGFGLIELVIVIGIIAILFALLLPAVQSAREAARRVECFNRLKQLGIATALFHDVKGELPSGTLLSDSETPYRSWHSQLLPWLEQQSLDEIIRRDYDALRDPFQPLYHPNFSKPNSAFACSSDPYSFESHFVSTYGTWAAVTSFQGVSGESYENTNGVLFGNSDIRYAEITDGLSNTFLAGERPCSSSFHYGWWYAGVGNGTGALDHSLGLKETAMPFNGTCAVAESGLRRPDRPRNECDVRFFWSFHPDGVSFLHCDGSVKFYSYSTNIDVSLRLASRN